jgi:hypothetical protein
MNNAQFPDAEQAFETDMGCDAILFTDTTTTQSLYQKKDPCRDANYVECSAQNYHLQEHTKSQFYVEKAHNETNRN